MADVTMPDLSARGLARRPPVAAPGPARRGRGRGSGDRRRDRRRRRARRRRRDDADRRPRPGVPTSTPAPDAGAAGRDVRGRARLVEPRAGAGGQPAAGRGRAAARGHRPGGRAAGRRRWTARWPRSAGRRPRACSSTRTAGCVERVASTGLDDVAKPNGYGYRPVHHSMLSPTGEYLVFPQDDGRRGLHGRHRRVERRSTPATPVTLDVTWDADDAVRPAAQRDRQQRADVDRRRARPAAEGSSPSDAARASTR